MAKKCYNTFLIMDCKNRSPILVTSSARKANDALKTGTRVEVWNCNQLVEKIYGNEKWMMNPYISAEKEHHAEKQRNAEKRNRTGIWQMKTI